MKDYAHIDTSGKEPVEAQILYSLCFIGSMLMLAALGYLLGG